MWLAVQVLMPHGLGHFMGIDTHDAGHYSGSVHRLKVGGYPKGAERDGRVGV